MINETRDSKVTNEIKQIPILFLGQCKNGSNSLADILENTDGIVKGKITKASCRVFNSKKSYYSNWDNIDISNAKYLLDKAAVRVTDTFYDGKGNENNKTIYMIRNPKKIFRSIFLVSLCMSSCYAKLVPLNTEFTPDEVKEFKLKDVIRQIETKKEKYIHRENVEFLFSKFNKENILFLTMEDMINEFDKSKEKLESFIELDIKYSEYPHENKTVDKFRNSHLYEVGNEIFDRYEADIFKYFIKKDDWQFLSDVYGQDLIKKYNL